MLLALGGCRMLGALWKGSGCPDVAPCAQMFPPMPLQHHRIRASTSTDVSKQLISSDRATAVSLPCPHGDQGLLTQDPATQVGPLQALAPNKEPPGLRVGTDPYKGAVNSPPAGCLSGPLTMCGTCWCPQPGRGPNPSHRLCRVESINGSREPGSRQRLIRLRWAAAPPAGINAACCRK